MKIDRRYTFVIYLRDKCALNKPQTISHNNVPSTTMFIRDPSAFTMCACVHTGKHITIAHPSVLRRRIEIDEAACGPIWIPAPDQTLYQRQSALTRSYDVRHISRSQESCQGQPRAHRCARFPAALLDHRDDADVVFANRHHASVRRQPDRLCAHKRHSRGRPQHILLDPLDVRAKKSV